MTRDFTTTVIDAGGRYGKHPTWKPFRGELAYHMFEPDAVEAERLRLKYHKLGNEVIVIDRALAKNPEARYDSGAQMAAALDDCRTRIASGSP